MTTNKKILRKELTSHLSQEFLNYRLQRNLTQEQFARMLGISVRSCCSIENGVYMPSLQTLIQFLCLTLTEEEAQMFIERIVSKFKQ